VRRLVLVLGDQLNFDSAAFDDFDADCDAVLMIEARHEATYVPQHKQRPVLFFSAMRHFRDELRERGFTVHYAALDAKHNRGSFREEVPRWVQKTHAETLVVAQPGDYRVQAELRGALRSEDGALDIRPDGHFLCTEEQFEEFAEGMQQSQRAAQEPALEHVVKRACEFVAVAPRHRSLRSHEGRCRRPRVRVKLRILGGSREL
jgi:deoxyribodipyrimidine photolyase-related protein